MAKKKNVPLIIGIIVFIFIISQSQLDERKAFTICALDEETNSNLLCLTGVPNEKKAIQQLFTPTSPFNTGQAVRTDYTEVDTTVLGPTDFFNVVLVRHFFEGEAFQTWDFKDQFTQDCIPTSGCPDYSFFMEFIAEGSIGNYDEQFFLELWRGEPAPGHIELIYNEFTPYVVEEGTPAGCDDGQGHSAAEGLYMCWDSVIKQCVSGNWITDDTCTFGCRRFDARVEDNLCTCDDDNSPDIFIKQDLEDFYGDTFSDLCVDSITVNEIFCDFFEPDGADLNNPLDCGSGFICSDGACIEGEPFTCQLDGNEYNEGEFMCAPPVDGVTFVMDCVSTRSPPQELFYSCVQGTDCTAYDISDGTTNLCCPHFCDFGCVPGTTECAEELQFDCELDGNFMSIGDTICSPSEITVQLCEAVGDLVLHYTCIDDTTCTAYDILPDGTFQCCPSFCTNGCIDGEFICDEGGGVTTTTTEGTTTTTTINGTTTTLVDIEPSVCEEAGNSCDGIINVCDEESGECKFNPVIYFIIGFIVVIIAFKSFGKNK